MKKKLIYSIKKRKQVNDLLDHLDTFFCLKNHERTISWQLEDKDGMAASITMDERYNRITLKIYPCFLNNSLEDQRMFLLHEMCHMLIRPIQSEAQDMFDGKLRTQDNLNFAVENATSKVTYLLDILLLNARKYMKKAYKDYARSQLSKSKKKNHMASKKAPMKKAAPKKK